MATTTTASTNNETKPEWYQENVTSISPDAQQVLENYSKLKPEEVLPHVLKVRDEAFSTFSYPCIGEMRFLSFNLSRMPFYHRILNALRSNPSLNFLDAGCCVGQEIRFLAHQGIPHKQLYGCDLQTEFVDIGYRLFKDQDTLEATFMKGDLLAPSEEYQQTSLAKTLEGQIDIVFASSLFHLWDYEEQLVAATRLVGLCREKEGVIITGRQVGSLFAGSYSIPSLNKGNSDKEGTKQYRHNTESIKGFWADVGQRSGTRWVVEAGYLQVKDIAQIRQYRWMDDNVQLLWWCATRNSQ